MTRRCLPIAFCSLLLAPAALIAEDAASAASTLPAQRILIHVHSDKPEQWRAALNKANQYMSAKPGTVLVEVLATGDGLKLIHKDSALKADVSASLEKDVSFVACHASMRTAHMTIDQLLSGVGTVPSGRREIAVRKADGWTVLDDKSLK